MRKQGKEETEKGKEVTADENMDINTGTKFINPAFPETLPSFFVLMAVLPAISVLQVRSFGACILCSIAPVFLHV